MATPLAIVSLILVGFAIYAAIQSLFNAYYRQSYALHLYFALMCIFGCGYVLIKLHGYAIHSPEAIVTTHRIAFLCAQLFFLAQIGFIREYAHWGPRWLVTTLVAGMIAMILLNLLLPYGIAHHTLPVYRQLSLPWGEVITDLRIHDKTPWWHLMWLSVFAIFLFQFAAAYQLKKSGQSQHGNALLWAGGIFLVAMLSNHMVNYYFIKFTPVAEFGFIALLIMMSLYLNREARDIQHRIQTAEDMLSTLVMNAPNFILIINADGVIRFINHKLPDVDANTLIGTSVEKYLQPESINSLRECLARISSTRSPTSVYLQLASPRNTWLDVQLAPQLTGDKIEHIIAIATNISEQIAIKQRLERSEARYRQLLNTLPYGVQEIDLEGRITFSNPAHDKLYGYAPGQMHGMSIFDLPAQDSDASALKEYINDVYTRQPEPQTYFIKDRKKNGELFDLKIDWDYLRGEQGEVTGLISVMSDISKQLKVEEALRDSEEKFRQLADNIEQVFFIRDLATNRMLYISPAYASIWGRSLDALYENPKDFIDSIHPQDKPRVLTLLAEQNHNGQLFDAEYRIIDSQGIVHWIHARTYPIRSNDGELHRVAGIVNEVTERKQTEQELQQSREFTDAIIDTTDAIIIVLDNQGHIVRFNHACENITGYSAKEVLGRVFWDFLILPEEREGVKTVFNSLTAGDFPNHYENYWLHKDGSKRLLAWSNTCICNQNGEVEHVMGTAVDITEQRNAEAALHESAEKYRTLIENASDIILVSDLDGRFIDCNGSALSFLGYSRDELLGLQVADIHPPEQRARNLADFQALRETGSVTTNDSTLLNKHGQVLPVDINADIIEYQGRKVAVAFMRDIRQRKQVEHEHLQAERRYRDMLVREVHHRIKNNLQGVIGLLRSSFDGAEISAEQSETLVNRAISQIRTIAMVHGLQAHYRAGEVRVCDVTRAIVEHAQAFIRDDIHLEYHDAIEAAALLQEEEAIPLALVINEIMTNAIKHIPADTSNKQVIVELKGSPDLGMELTVFNSGARLPTDLHPGDHNRSGAGVGLDLIHALLPRQYTRFSLQEDQAGSGVSAKLHLEPGILKPLVAASEAGSPGQLPN